MRFPEGEAPGIQHILVFALIVVVGAGLGVAGVFLPLTSVTSAHSLESVDYDPSYFSDFLDNGKWSTNWPVTNGKQVFIPGVLTVPCALLALAFRGWPLASVPMVLNAVALMVTFVNVNYLGQVGDLDSGIYVRDHQSGVVAMAPLAALLHAGAGLVWIFFRSEPIDPR